MASKVPDWQQRCEEKLAESKNADWPPPDDPLKATPKEAAVIKRLIADVPAELKATLDGESDQYSTMLRFTRGFYFNQFKKEQDAEAFKKTSLILNMFLDWRHRNNVNDLWQRKIERQDEFDQAFCHGITGEHVDGHPVIVMMPFGKEIKESFTFDEFKWLHWQTKENALRRKAMVSRKLNRIVLDDIMIIDFGDGDRFRPAKVGKDTVNYFKDAITYTPPSHFGFWEDSFALDNSFYPDTLKRLYMLNTSFGIRMVWAFAKMFMHPTTRAKFQLLGSNASSNLKIMTEGGVPLDALPQYLGGNAPNPPGLLHHVSIKSGSQEVDEVKLTENCQLFLRVKSDQPLSVSGSFETDEVVALKVQANGTWHSTTYADPHPAGRAMFEFSNMGDGSASIVYELTVKSAGQVAASAKAVVNARSPMSAPKPRRKRPKQPLAAAIVKRTGYHDSVTFADVTPLPPMEGTLYKHSGWWNGMLPRFFKVCNEYLNYYESEKDKEFAPLGSYNLKKVISVTHGGNSKHHVIDIVLKDEGKSIETRQLKAASREEAEEWITKLNERRKWFEGVHDAAEAEEKTARLAGKPTKNPSAAPRPQSQSPSGPPGSASAPTTAKPRRRRPTSRKALPKDNYIAAIIGLLLLLALTYAYATYVAKVPADDAALAAAEATALPDAGAASGEL